MALTPRGRFAVVISVLAVLAAFGVWLAKDWTWPRLNNLVSPPFAIRQLNGGAVESSGLGSATLFQLSKATGEVQWSTAIPEPEVPDGEIFIGADAVVVGSWGSPAGAIGVDATNGATIWQATHPNVEWSIGRFEDVVGMGFAGEPADQLVAVDAVSGEQLWLKNLSASFHTSSVVSGDIVIYNDEARSALVGLDIQTGTEKWFQTVSGGGPILTDGRQAYTIGSGSVATAVEIDTGTTVWVQPKMNPSFVRLGDGYLVGWLDFRAGGVSKTHIAVVDTDDGALLWDKNVKDSTRIIVAGDALAIEQQSSLEENILVVDARTGEKLFEVAGDNDVLGFTEDILLLGSWNLVVALHLADGHMVWELEVVGQAAPSISEDGVVYFGVSEILLAESRGWIFAINKDR